MDELKSLSPEELYGELFYDVMSVAELFGEGKLFNDCKDFVDSIPKYGAETIREKYSVLPSRREINTLTGFINENFEIPHYKPSFTDSAGISEHIGRLWSFLRREPDLKRAGTLIPLKHPYIVPGGRFREIYYWDSYFTMLGLQADGHYDIIRSMADNFSDLIDRYGFIPNGNRSYYLSRSHPPFFASIVDLLTKTEGNDVLSEYREQLEKEYDFWMNGSEDLDENKSSSQHVVLLEGGEILNRYFDKENTPRPEMYREDTETALLSKGRISEEVYRDLRSAAESGWDFSSRWLANKCDLETIETTSIIPVDLNSLLYNLELIISRACDNSGDKLKALAYRERSERRKDAIIKYCWDSEKGFFMDYNFRKKSQTEIFSLAGVYPLFFNIASAEQGSIIAEKIEASFLKQGGVVTTLTLNSPYQQWDFPNGWAPLQWITISGLRNYGYNELADKIKTRWLALNEAIYKKTGKMLEKYDVAEMQDTGGGEYPNQDGFGWTNGVYQRLSKEKTD